MSPDRTPQQEFSLRLQHTLQYSDYAGASASGVAREFNQRSGALPVTAYAVCKWLCGQSIRTQSRLRVLAQWLGVNASRLRCGTIDAPLLPQFADMLPAADQQKIDRFDQISASDRELVIELMRLSKSLQEKISTAKACSAASRTVFGPCAFYAAAVLPHTVPSITVESQVSRQAASSARRHRR